MYKPDLALDNLNLLICHKTKLNNMLSNRVKNVFDRIQIILNRSI